MTADNHEHDNTQGQAEPTVDCEAAVQAEAGEQKTTLELAEEEIARLKDQMIREQAELQNQRKRMQRDIDNARKFALEKFASDLLPVVDNLERAIQAAGDDPAIKPLLEGVQLTHKSFLDALERFHIKQLNPIGEPFDPQYHEAVTALPNPEMEPDSVMDCVQKGYLLNDRLLRAAMVVVSRAP